MISKWLSFFSQPFINKTIAVNNLNLNTKTRNLTVHRIELNPMFNKGANSSSFSYPPPPTDFKVFNVEAMLLLLFL